MILRWIFAGVLFVSGAAIAQETINQLGSASTLTGTELVPIFQGASPAVQTSTQSIANLAVTGVFTSCANVISGGEIKSVGQISSVQISLKHVTGDTISNSECGEFGAFNSASAIAITLPQANANSQFLPGWYEEFTNYGAGTVTFTLAGGTFLTSGTPTTFSLAQNKSIKIISSSYSHGNWDVRQ